MKKLLNKINLHSVAFLALWLTLASQAAAEPAQGNTQLPYYNSATFTPSWLNANSEALNDFHKISNFSWLNQDGDLITNNTFKNKVYVASFFFTACPGICPKMRSRLSKVQQAFLTNDNVAIISHSIQPANDTVQVLKEYADDHGIKSGKWHLVTGNRDDIYNIAREDYFANEDLGEFVSNQDFLHTENLVLIDTNRHIRGIYNGLNKTSVAHLIGDIELLLKQAK